MAARTGRVAGLHPTRAAEIVVGDEIIGAVGEIDPGVLADFGIAERVGVARGRPRHAARPAARRPPVPVGQPVSRRATSTWPSRSTTPRRPADVERVIRAAGGDLLSSVELFDVFRGDPVADGRRSLAYTLRLQAPDRTLTDDDVASLRQRIIDAVESGLPASLRS